ncbi:MAG: 2-C-methyl-D-erythritol 2,4-cyclodiphosphate synthase, partial [Actinomycetota bacterium]|nr:2-C-methyl-D-erythritol 2,4-cyclodiphosphate synthase [Actinomycetota bacterium]
MSGEAWAVLVAGGKGKRFGGPKHRAELRGRPLWEWGRRALLEGGAAQVVVVGPVPGGVEGGSRRRDSVRAGLERVPDHVRFVLVHDAARPLASPALVKRVIERLRVGDVQGVVPALVVRDALKQVEGEWVVGTIEREQVMTAQTPQGFVTQALKAAHAELEGDAADDAALVEKAGGEVVVIVGESANLKVTYPEDIDTAEALLPPPLLAGVSSLPLEGEGWGGGDSLEKNRRRGGGLRPPRGEGMRVGWGFDAHRLGASRPLRLAGVVVDAHQGLAGTSDADVAAHAVADALLGAAALGDLGTYFPSSDPRWEGADSMGLLREVVEHVTKRGFRVGSLDLTVLAEAVRVAPHREEMRNALAAVLRTGVELVSVKATTTDGMGWLGAGDGVAAMAVAVLSAL